MASTLSSRPNHYEKLGLKPTASAQEIVRAFADRIGGFRPLSVGSLAELSTAYETLRNPAKRRAYDASLGLRPEQPAAARPLWPQISGSARFIGTDADAGSAPLIRSAVRRPVSPPPAGISPAEPKPQPAREPRAAPPLARAAPEPAGPVTLDPFPDRARAPEPRPRAQAEPKPHPQPQAKPDLALQLAQHHAARRSAPAGPRDADDWPIQWKRPAIAAGGVVAAALLIGGFAGMSVGTASPPQAEAAVTTSLPALKPMLDDGGSQPPAPEIAEAVQAEPVRHERAAAPVKRTQSRQSRIEQIQAQLMQADPSQPEAGDVAGQAQTIATDEVAAAPAAVVPAAAALPLPKAVIARTIHRIGYPCGQVASATAIDGDGPAVFKVTCTSGNSYRAAPVRGRYHFRRLGSR